jgi:hypothetical protein
MRIKQVLTRFYIHDLEKAIAFYEKMLQEKCALRFKYSQLNLEIAQIESILLISGPEESLNPLKATTATFLVDSIMEFKDLLLNEGALIVRNLRETATEISMTIKHIDGTTVEYVEQKIGEDS